MKNKEKFANEIINIAIYGGNIALDEETKEIVDCSTNCIDCCECAFYDGTKANTCRLLRAKWANEEFVEPILTNEERLYLLNVIKPYQVICISLNEWDNSNCFLSIELNTPYDETIDLPVFEKGTMYKGMKIGVKYTLEELGVDYGIMDKKSR